jgi:hypothetical protein
MNYYEEQLNGKHNECVKNGNVNATHHELSNKQQPIP